MKNIKKIDNVTQMKNIKRLSLVSFIFVTITATTLIGGLLILTIAINNDLLRRSESPNGQYTIESYLKNASSSTNWTVKCYLKTEGKLGKKIIYTDNTTKNPNVVWLSNDIVWIDGHEIDLPNGEYDFRNKN